MHHKSQTIKSITSLFFLLAFSCFQSIGQQYYAAEKYTEALSPIRVMKVSHERNLLVCGDEQGYIYLRNLSDGKLMSRVRIHENSVNTIQFNSTGKLMISSTGDGEIKIFDFEKEKIIQGIYSPDYDGLRFVLFSIADGFIYFNSKNRLYKTRSDLTQKVDLIYTFEDSLKSAVITPDRNSLIIAEGSRIKVINTRSDMLRLDFSTGESSIEQMTLLGDSLLVTWSNDGFIRYWPYQTGQVSIQPSHWFKAGAPSSMNFSSDGKLMVSGNIGNWARVWSPRNRIMKQELFGHSSTVYSSAFGTDSTSLFTGSADKSIIHWKYSGKPVEQIAQTIHAKTINQDSIPLLQIFEVHDSSAIVPDVIMSNENIPSIIQGRTVSGTVLVEVNSPDLTIYVYDNGYVDGDTMSLFFNGEWILYHYGVTKKKKPVELVFKPNTNNYLVLFANNLGKSPPNTAAVEVNDGKNKRIFKLSSNLSSCSAINFFYKKE